MYTRTTTFNLMAARKEDNVMMAVDFDESFLLLRRINDVLAPFGAHAEWDPEAHNITINHKGVPYEVMDTIEKLVDEVSFDTIA